MKSNKQRILNEAKKQFSTNGFYGTSIQSITDELGLSKQALLHYYPSKEKIYGAVLGEAADNLTNHLSKAMESEHDSVKAIDTAIDAFDEFHKSEPAISRLLIREMIDNIDRSKKAKQWYLLPFFDLFISAIKKGQAEGVFNSKITPVVIMYQITSACHYYAISIPTLKKMLGPEEFQEMNRNYNIELKKLVKSRLLIHGSK